MEISHEQNVPRVDPGAWVAPTAVLSGDVRVGPGSCVLHGAVLNADGGAVRIGANCVIMENAVLRGTPRHPLTIGDHVLAGPNSYLTGATIGDEVFIATGAMVFNGATMGAASSVALGGAVHIGCVVPPQTRIPIGWVAVGDPARLYPPGEADSIRAGLEEAGGFLPFVFGTDRSAPRPEQAGGTPPYTTLDTSPVTQEEPFLTTGPNGSFRVFVPALRYDSAGPSWSASSPGPGTSLPLSQFFIASPATPVSAINLAVLQGDNLILSPGVYHLNQPILISHPHTIVLGLGFPTLVPQYGLPAMLVASVPGVKLSGMIFDAGPVRSPVLLQIGGARTGSPAQPTLVQDVFFRIGGATAGKAATSLVVNSSDVILDDVWAWRADHGTGVGWTANTADTGVVVNGDNVTAYGLFVEHFQKTEVIWNGQHGEDIFFQNEMPYDPPDQASWQQNASTPGYPAFTVTPGVRTFTGYGMGSYCFFNQGVPIESANAYTVPNTPGVQLHDLLTVFLNGSGGIDHVINGTGAASTAASQGVPSNVVSFP
jgi:carbonic anhydrase/acetyltransferase-like protein (isoleucine patch superfamily)